MPSTWMITAAMVAALAGICWPRLGLLARLVQRARARRRILAEDALKHLHESGYAGRPATLESLAGTLRRSGSQAIDLIAWMERDGLVRCAGETLRLTELGRVQALRVLRGHRLWERFLADRTGVPAPAWHRLAETMEHSMSADQVEQLAQRMGQPRYDPHGDPIPSSHGDLPPRQGLALNALAPGRPALVVHLEDEPTELYRRLVRLGLAPGTVVEVLDVQPDMIRFHADGRELQVEPVVARNVTVLPSARAAPPSSDTLWNLPVGASATVVGISPACQGLQRHRLMDLGLTPGASIRAELVGVFADPVAYRIRGALIALRRQQAEWVRIRRGDPVAGES
jgi:DtxR family Mn-dependent transcriptional regulator